MLLKKVSLLAMILSLAACGDSSETAVTTPVTAPAKTEHKTEVMGMSTLEKAKEVQGVVDNTAHSIDEAVEKNTQ